MTLDRFPRDFLWGSATAAHQFARHHATVAVAAADAADPVDLAGVL